MTADLGAVPSEVLELALERSRRRQPPHTSPWTLLHPEAVDEGIGLLVHGIRPALGWWRRNLPDRTRTSEPLRPTQRMIAKVVAELVLEWPEVDPSVVVEVAVNGSDETEAIEAFQAGLRVAERVAV